MQNIINIICAIGVPAIVVCLIYIGRKLQKLDDVDDKLKNVDSKVIDIDKLTLLTKEKVDTLWNERFAISNSPMQLNERGEMILDKSGIKEIIDKHLDELFIKVKEKNPENAYQVQERSNKVVYKLENKQGILPILENGAYKTGVDIDTVLAVGGLYLRDLILPKFNFKFEEIDKHDPNSTNNK